MAEQHTLEIKDLYASVETKEGRKQILKGVNLTVHSGDKVPPSCVHVPAVSLYLSYQYDDCCRYGGYISFTFPGISS